MTGAAQGNPAHRHIVSDAPLATAEDFERIAGILLDGMEARGRGRDQVLDDAHREHHEWVAAQIRKDQAKAEFYSNLATKGLPTIIAALIVAAIGGIWQLVKAHWN